MTSIPTIVKVPQSQRKFHRSLPLYIISNCFYLEYFPGGKGNSSFLHQSFKAQKATKTLVSSGISVGEVITSWYICQDTVTCFHNLKIMLTIIHMGNVSPGPMYCKTLQITVRQIIEEEKNLKEN